MEDYEWKDEVGDFALVPVPPGERRGLAATFLTYTGVLATIAVLLTGGTLGTTFNFTQIILVSVSGCAVLAVIGGLIAPMGPISGCSTYVNIRFPFGRMGAWIFGTIVAGFACGIGWFAVQTWFFGIFVNAIAPQMFLSKIWVAAIWGGILMILTAIYGYKGLATLSYLVVPMFILLAGVGMVASIGEAGGLSALLEATPAKSAPFTTGITAVIGAYIAGATITSDISRYCRRPRDGSIAWIVQVLVLMPFMLAGGGAMVLATGKANVAFAMAGLGMGLGAFLLAMFGQWTTNDNNLYSGALSFNTYLPIRKSVLTAIIGAIGTGIAAYWGVTARAGMQPFMNFLHILGKLLPAIAGGLIADFYVYRKYLGIEFSDRYQVETGMKIPELNWAGIVAAVIGMVVGGWLTPGIAAVNSLLISFALYLVIAVPCTEMEVPIGIGEHELPKTGR